jgi:hypothetical protein
MEEERMRREPRYFVAVFGGKYEDKDPVDGQRYPLARKYWPSEYYPKAGIAQGDIALLFCTKSYPGYPDKMPGVGVVCCIEEGQDTNTMWYRYLRLTQPIDRSTIRSRMTAGDSDKMENLHPPFRRLFVIQNESGRSVLAGCQIAWP